MNRAAQPTLIQHPITTKGELPCSATYPGAITLARARQYRGNNGPPMLQPQLIERHLMRHRRRYFGDNNETFIGGFGRFFHARGKRSGNQPCANSLDQPQRFGGARVRGP